MQPLVEERFRVVLDRASGAPLASFYHSELFSEQSDTTMMEHDLQVKSGRVVGSRRVGRKNGAIDTLPVSTAIPRDAVWFNYELYAAAVTNAAPGDSLIVPDYIEQHDAIGTLAFVAEKQTTVQVPAGQFEVLPLRSGQFRLYVTREPPRRVVKGETVGGRFRFELARTGPVVPSEP